MKSKLLFADAIFEVPLDSSFLPFFKPLHVTARFDEKLHFHLFKFTGSKNKIPGGDFISECLSNLGNPEWDFLPAGLVNVEEVDVDPLRCFRPKVNDRRRVFQWTHMGFEHEVELTGLSQFSSALRTFFLVEDFGV